MRLRSQTVRKASPNVRCPRNGSQRSGCPPASPSCRPGSAPKWMSSPGNELSWKCPKLLRPSRKRPGVAEWSRKCSEVAAPSEKGFEPSREVREMLPNRRHGPSRRKSAFKKHGSPGLFPTLPCHEAASNRHRENFEAHPGQLKHGDRTSLPQVSGRRSRTTTQRHAPATPARKHTDGLAGSTIAHRHDCTATRRNSRTTAHRYGRYAWYDRTLARWLAGTPARRAP